MANTHHHHDTLNSLFFKDLIDIYPASERAYRCASISDIDYAKLGILRCISHAKTGQEFLQHHADKGQADIDPGHFFNMGHLASWSLPSSSDFDVPNHSPSKIRS